MPTFTPRTLFAFTAVAAVLALLSNCRQTPVVGFTKPPPRSAFIVEPKPTMTGIFIGLPVAAHEALKVIEEAVSPRVAHIAETIGNAACAQRTKTYECAPARVDGEIERAGPIELAAENGRLVLRVPLSVTLTARGLGWAKAVEETKKQAFVATAEISAVLQNDHALGLSGGEEWVASERAVGFGKSQFDLGKHLQASLRPVLVKFLDRLALDLAALPVSASLQRVWRTLHHPVHLAKTPVLWLTADPVRLSGAGFHQDAGKLSYLVAVAVRAVLHEGKQPTPARVLNIKKLPEPSRMTQDMQATHMRLSALVDSNRLQAAAARGFPSTEKLTTQGDRFGDAVVVSPRQARVYASQRQLALELDVDIHAPKNWAGQLGRLHLLGRPLLDAGKDVIVLDTVSLPPPTPRDTRDDAQMPSQPALRIAAEPFAGKFTKAMKIDIAEDVRTAVAQINAALERQIDEHQSLSLRFAEGQAIGVEPVADGVLIAIGVTGKLVIHDDGQQLPSTAATSGKDEGARLPAALTAKRISPGR